MNLENLRMLEFAFEHLAELRDEVVFVGGATVELWITDPAAPEFRPLSKHHNFDPGLEGALPSSPEARDRVDLVVWPRIREMME
jgi:hypothetical protein